MGRTTWSLALLVAGSVIAAACTSSGGSDPAPGRAVQVRTEYDLTVVDDRALFEEQDLEYRSAVGPYAVYEVTGPEPRLLGPEVYFWDREGGGYAMLCGASEYFAPEGSERHALKVQLLGGADGDEVIVQAQQGFQYDGGCTGARDDTGARIPPDRDDDVEAIEGAGPDPDAPLSSDSIEQMNVAFAEPPPLGAEILLRRVALSGVSPGHNDSHVIPRVCCTDGSCALQ